MIVILGVALLIAIVLVILAVANRDEALTQTRIALSRQLSAQALAELGLPVGNDEFAALLAVRSLNIQYDPVADGALVEAAVRLPIRGFIGHSDAVLAVAYSPDGQFVTTASADHTARMANKSERLAGMRSSASRFRPMVETW